MTDSHPKRRVAKHRRKSDGADSASPESGFRSLTAPARSRRASERAADRVAAKTKRRGPFSRVALILGIVFFVVAICIAAFLVYKYVSADAQNKGIEAAAGFDSAAANGSVAPDATLDGLAINWEALKEINPDIIAWVMIPGTRINYPIVQTSDNDYYLSHLSDRTPSDVGAIFLDYENDPGIDGWNNMIYGHNLLDGSMFAGLKQYREKDYFDAHKRILIATPEKNYSLDVVAILVCDDKDEVRRLGFTDQEDYEAYIRMLLEYSVLSELDEGEIPEKLYCFATCTDTNYAKRTIVCAIPSDSSAPKGND